MAVEKQRKHKIWLRTMVLVVLVIMITGVYFFKKNCVVVNNGAIPDKLVVAHASVGEVVSVGHDSVERKKAEAKPEAKENRTAPKNANQSIETATINCAVEKEVVTGNVEQHSASANQQSEKIEEKAITPVKRLRLVDLGASSCVPCRMMLPVLTELKQEYSGRVEVEIVDVYDNSAAVYVYRIRTIPTQILFDSDGNEVFRHEGFIAKADLANVFQKYGVK